MAKTQNVGIIPYLDLKSLTQDLNLSTYWFNFFLWAVFNFHLRNSGIYSSVGIRHGKPMNISYGGFKKITQQYAISESVRVKFKGETWQCYGSAYNLVKDWTQDLYYALVVIPFYDSAHGSIHTFIGETGHIFQKAWQIQFEIPALEKLRIGLTRNPGCHSHNVVNSFSHWTKVLATNTSKVKI